MVKVIITGKGDIKSIKIDPTLLIPADVEVLEDLTVAACRDAKEKADAYSAEAMAGVGEGLSLPAGLKLPF